MTSAEKENMRILAAVRSAVSSGLSLSAALLPYGRTPKWFAKMDALEKEAGVHAFSQLKRTGRPPKILFSEAAKEYARKIYMKTNLNRDAGSMTYAWRLAAKTPDSPLTEAERRAILDVNNKHCLPQDAKRALRIGSAVVHRYRDPKAGQNDGIYTPGWIRMATDGTRRLLPGERQVWDDASVNFGVVVPWQRGGDKCSDRFGCRVARFQLLLGVDVATDFCVGYSYVMRNNDAYNSSDVCASLLRCWKGCGYVPDEIVLEGGAWQANRTLEMMNAAGAKVISAKGRPNQKVVEGFFNRLWTHIGPNLKGGDVGRFRGEMVTETKHWIDCREGRDDPRKHFPDITEFLAGLDKTILYLNNDVTHSQEYGSHVPAESYAEQRRLGHRIPDGLRNYGLPVREVRTVFRGGLVKVLAASPFGFNFPYLFAMKEGYMFDGAKALVAFDPADIQAGAVVELAERFREWPKGHVIDTAAGCISAAPMIWHAADGAWTAGTLDAREDARLIKRGSRALIGAKAAAFDERGVKAKVAVDDKAKVGFSLGNVAPVIREEEEQPEPDWAKLERDALMA